MLSRSIKSNMKHKALVIALGVCVSGGAWAQSNAAGAVAGHATAGDTITITNPDTGFSRTITVGSDGNYRFSQMPTGNYTISRNGSGARPVTINVGTAANVDFATASAATGKNNELGTITVTGNVINPIDVSSVESTTVMTAEQIKKIPVQNNITQVALLAPGTVRGDAAFGNLASFGGSSVAENQYYLNGFAITNAFRNLAFSQVPFEAIAEQQIKTGGYGAEFGRSTGGVINLISKRGTNKFHAGGNIYWTPESLVGQGRDVYRADGTLRQNNSEDTNWSARANVWASGALIKDRLFAYGILSYGKEITNNFGSIVSETNTGTTQTTPNWLLKLDWEINDKNRLEFTNFSDLTKNQLRVYENQPGVLERGRYVGTSFVNNGGDNYILKYTGYLTNNFTLSALGGYGKYSRAQHLTYANGLSYAYSGDLNQPPGGCPVIVDNRTAARQAITGAYVSTCNLTGAVVERNDSHDTRKQFRIDAEWRLGKHIFRGGVDIDNFSSVAGTTTEGGTTWIYGTRANGTDQVTKVVISQGSTVAVKQRAYYIDDSWSITNNLMVYLGARWDNFKNLNGIGQEYVSIKNQFSPRLGLSWDVYGDSTFKVFANAGRYALPLTPSVAVRGASKSIFSRQRFTFTGVDPATGAPIGTAPIDQVFYLNGEFGLAKDAQTIAAKNLTPMYQDEYIVGFQKTLTEHMSLGVRAIHRNLKAAIDDNCDYTAVMAANGLTQNGDGDWVNASGQVGANFPNTGFPSCRLFNPGKDAVFVTDLLGNGQRVTNTIPAAALSPRGNRKYSAMEFFFNGQWKRLFLQGSYTYAKSYGNTEGGVKSDIGQNDTSTTQDFDYKELMVDANGYLPNDRRHSLKLFGNYQITDEWSVGANFLVQSGRPINCLGDLQVGTSSDGTPIFHAYGSSFFQCGGKPTPRGTVGRLPWTQQIDVNLAYKPTWAKGLQLKMDVFNLLNKQKVTSVSEIAENADTGNPLGSYLQPLSFQAPRSIRFMLQYEF